MKGAVLELASFSEDLLFEEIADGVPLILENAENLEAVAHRLFVAKEYRASEIIRGFAEEEAAKVLILLDAVRCPTESRRDTLKCFYNHLAKRIYALTCSFPNIVSFEELGDLVAGERQPHYLDGPNSVDWIFTNSITTERERAIYVDYVQDITETSGGYAWWSALDVPGTDIGPYERPESVDLCRALCAAGAKSKHGLAVIAEMWSGFVPEEDTSREDLRDLIVSMLTRLVEGGHGVSDQSAVNRIVSSWSFPLWPFRLHASPASKTVAELREERRLTIEWIERTEARREPPPAIARAKVEAMSGTYAAWRDECEKEDARRGQGKKYGTSAFRSSSELAKDFDLPSYKRLEAMFEELDASERAALLALAWFTRDTVANWPRVYERARTSSVTLGMRYQIGNGQDWLAGLERWEEKPRTFRAGRKDGTTLA